jgi:hypothetical protein
MKFLIPITLLVLAVGIFYGAFFKVAPWLCTLLPNNDWQKILSAVIYFVVAYVGGIGLPIGLVVWAIIAFVIAKNLD